MQIQSDPLLGWVTIQGQDYLVQQLNDHKAAVDLTVLGAGGLSEYAAVCGELLARGHTRSGDVHRIAGYLGDGEQFVAAILAFAQAYADQTICDWTQFASELKSL